MELQEMYELAKGATPPDLYKEYAALDAQGIEDLLALILADSTTDVKDKQDPLLYLVLYAWGGGERLPKTFYRYLLDNEVFWPSELYMRADDEVLQELIQQLDGATEEHRLAINHVVGCIAAIGSPAASAWLQKASREPLPAFTQWMHWLPEKFPQEYGWEPEGDGGVRKLYNDAVQPFERCEPDAPGAKEGAPMKNHDAVCGFCGTRLTECFDGLATCLHCCCYGQPCYVKWQDGRLVWHEKNKPESFFANNPKYMENPDGEPMMDYALRPTGEKRLPLYTASEWPRISLSTRGGMLTPVNFDGYPVCPDCGRTMVFAAQMDYADLQNYGEGLTYFFTCEDCGVVGAGYGQT